MLWEWLAYDRDLHPSRVGRSQSDHPNLDVLLLEALSQAVGCVSHHAIYGLFSFQISPKESGISSCKSGLSKSVTFPQYLHHSAL